MARKLKFLGLIMISLLTFKILNMKTRINKMKIGVWLPNKLFQALKREIMVYNNSTNGSKLNLSKAAYILNPFYFIPLNSERKYGDDW